jgi:retrograde regulation protein 2
MLSLYTRLTFAGGSTQITWMIAKDGHVQTSPKGSISLPYGAAAMTRQLAELDIEPTEHLKRQKSHSPVKTPRELLEDKMKQQFQQAYADLDLPESLQHKANHGGLTLYLSGGGFRGWGYLLMSQHKVSPYPIPIINGFGVTKYIFQQTAEITALAAEQSVFRISQRRAAQVPAVAYLVNVLVNALPMIQQVRFCQGGVREGFLYDTLDAPTKALNPLEAATKPYGTSSAAELASLLWDSLPGENNLDRSLPATFTPSLVRAVADMMYVHLPQPKETRPVSALHAPITGILAAAHGIAHADRAILALTLFMRWGSVEDLPPPHTDLKKRLCAILTHQEGFWANYLGRVAALIGTVYPSGIISPSHLRLKFSAHWADGLGKKGLSQGVKLKLRCRKLDSDPMTCPAALNPLVEEVERVGKKKNHVGEEHSKFGVPVDVGIERDLI